MTKAFLAACALSVLAALPSHAQFRPGQRQYATIAQHDPGRMQTLVNAAKDALRSGDAKQFRILVNGRGVLMLIPGLAANQKDLAKTVAGTRGLTVVACKEIIDQLAKRNRGRLPPLLLNARVENCAGSMRKLDADGWYRVPGL